MSSSSGFVGPRASAEDNLCNGVKIIVKTGYKAGGGAIAAALAHFLPREGWPLRRVGLRGGCQQ